MFSVAVVMLMRNRKLENIGIKVQKGKKKMIWAFQGRSS